MSDSPSDDLSDEVIDHLDVSDSETVRRHAATFRKARLARLAAVEAERDEPSDEVPPQVAGRDARSDEVPRGAAGIAKHARAHGWRVREVYSRGPEGVETVSVRCWGRGAWACALYRRPGEKWLLSAALVADAAGGLRRVKAAELRAFVAAHAVER